MNDNKQSVTVELIDEGKFQVKGGSADDLNPKALILCGAAKCAGFTVMSLLKKGKITPKEQECGGRAVTLAQEKYCGTVDMLRKIAPVAHEISIVSTETMKV